MSHSEIIRIVKAELKENLIFRQIYYHNTSPNIDNKINYIILKLNKITYLFHCKQSFQQTAIHTSFPIHSCDSKHVKFIVFLKYL